MMTDLSQMIRWNANFVRGLAESVLNRAKVIRSTLTPVAAAASSSSKVKGKKPKAPKKATVKRATKPRKKRADA